jgi:hypothetical protein
MRYAGLHRGDFEGDAVRRHSDDARDRDDLVGPAEATLFRLVAVDFFDDHEMDPRLIERFTLFREPAPGPDGALKNREMRVAMRLFPDGRSGVRARARAQARELGLLFGETRKVVLDTERTIVVVPGRAGVHVTVLESESMTGSLSRTEERLDGSPLIPGEKTLFGIAPDGCEQQPVTFSDGSHGYAPVRHNAYAIEDPSLVVRDTPGTSKLGEERQPQLIPGWRPPRGPADLTRAQLHPPEVILEWLRTVNPSLGREMTDANPGAVALGWQEFEAFVGDPATIVPPEVVAALVGYARSL